jgi:transcriptional regulator with XRE-family HTH domain
VGTSELALGGTYTVQNSDQDGSLADRLNRLFDRIPSSTRQLYTNAAAAAELTASGTPITAMYMGELRSGKKDNPSFKLLAGIARMFGVKLDYFTDDSYAAEIDRQINQLILARDNRIEGMMTRVTDLSDEGIENLDGIIRQIRKLEGLDK